MRPVACTPMLNVVLFLSQGVEHMKHAWMNVEGGCGIFLVQSIIHLGRKRKFCSMWQCDNMDGLGT